MNFTTKLLRSIKQNSAFLIASILYLIIKFIISDFCFFWDSIAGVSLPAHFLYENNFSSFIYPSTFVAEPPLVHTYIALFWKFFGKTLFVTHLGLSLIGVGVIYQLYRLSRHYNIRSSFILFPFLLLEPSLITQTLIISSDIFLFFFAILTINSVLDNKRFLISLGALGLALTSTRAFAIASGIGFGYFLIQQTTSKQNPFITLLYCIKPFISSIVVLLSFFIFRKITYGVFLLDPESQWIQHRQWTDFPGFLKNLLTLGWIFIDYGRIAVWLVTFWLIYRIGFSKLIKKANRPLAFILFGISLSLGAITLPLTNPFGHRYFIIHYILIVLLALLLIEELKDHKSRYIARGFIAIALITGHLWIYPEKKAQGWDASLAHLPYYSLRQEAIEYIESQNIPFEQVGFGFPNTAPIKVIELNQNSHHFNDIDLSTNHYVIYTNISNLDSPTIDRLKQKWTLLKSFEKFGIFMHIYQKPTHTNASNNPHPGL